MSHVQVPDPASPINFGVALKTWKDVSLPSLQKSMDTTALEIVELQKENMIGRKKLAEQTRDFKRLPDDATKVNSIKSLLKAYQQEIDSLTKRSQRSESTFLSVYKLLAEAPDPYPLLEAAIDQAIQVEEAMSLKAQFDLVQEENHSLRSEIKALKSAEDGRKKAELRASSLEEKMESILSERLQQKENELSAQYDERLRNYHEREVDLQKQLKTLRAQLTDLHTSNEDTQTRLANASQRLDQDTVAKLVELDSIVDELQRANERVATVERRNEILRSEIECARSDSGETEQVKELRSHLRELEVEIAHLIDTTEGLRKDKSTQEQQYQRSTETLERKLADANGEVVSLRTKLQSYRDYDEVKRELEILKYIEFAGGDYTDIDGSHNVQLPNPNPDKTSGRAEGSLETLFAQKNKKLQEENARLRVAHEECHIENDKLKVALAATEDENARQTTLIQELENDLIRVQVGGKSLDNNFTSRSALGNESQDMTTYASGKGSGTPHGRGSPTMAALPLRSSKDLLEATISDSNAPSESDRSILPIVTGQRDRFRQRNAELEEELRRQYNIISELRAEIKTLQADNLKLYEKVRYMQSYRNDMSTVSGQSGASVRGEVESSGGSNLKNAYGDHPNTRSRDGDLGKYRDKYEQSMNPFEAFRGREAQRAVQALNPLERAVFALTRKVVSNKRARNVFILYTGAIHALFLYMLLECSSPPGT